MNGQASELEDSAVTNRVIVLGSINVDTTYRVEHFPQPGETISANDKHVAPGGKGANQAVAAARSGAHTAFIGAVGNDDDGRAMIKQLQENHIDTQHVMVDNNHATGSALVTVEESGQNNILVYGGANQALTTTMVGSVDGLLEKADFLVAQFETPQAVTVDLFRQAKAHGVVTILNPAPAHSIDPQLFEYTDLIIPNETEAEKLTGVAVTDRDSMQATAAWFRQHGIPNVMITLGEHGVFYAIHDQVGQVPAFRVKAVDTTAAGDTFVGALAAELTPQLTNIKAAITYAQRASSLAVQKNGAMPSIPDRAAIEQQ